MLSCENAVLWSCCLVAMLFCGSAAFWPSLAIPEGLIALLFSSCGAAHGWSLWANSWCTYLLPFYAFCAATLQQQMTQQCKQWFM